MVCFDLTRMDTFEAVNRWVSQIKNSVGDKVPMLLIGNKVDLEEDRVINKQEAETLAE